MHFGAAGPARCPSGEIGRHKGLEINLSPLGETREVTPVKFGERPGCAHVVRARANAEPSRGSTRVCGRCREQTAGTYGREARVKACSRPRTAALVAAGGESRSGKKIPRLRGRAGSIPASGTISIRSGGRASVRARLNDRPRGALRTAGCRRVRPMGRPSAPGARRRSPSCAPPSITVATPWRHVFDARCGRAAKAARNVRKCPAGRGL